MKIFFQLYRKNGKPYVTTSTNSVNVVIQLKNEQVACTKQIDAEDADQNAIKTSFTVHKSGSYKISIMVSGRHVKGSPFTKTFEPGEKCSRTCQFSWFLQITISLKYTSSTKMNFERVSFLTET